MNRVAYLSITCLIILFLSATSISCQEKKSGNAATAIPGKTTGAVRCSADTSQSYALYLPSSYSSGKKWPVLFCFDPHGEGLLPVNLFRDQAEKFGYILAGSNISRNGMSTDETTAIFQKMKTDLLSHFSIDENSIYLAGFSGGSRVAGAIAITEGNIAGVIGCGAGLPNLNRQPSTPFSYLAVAGNQDFNYNELRNLDQMLEGAGFTHHLLVFDGPHQWPPKELTSDIFTWINFDRMRKGSLEVDRQAINTFIDQRYKESESAASRKDYFKQRALLILMKDYLEGLTDVAPLESEIRELDQNSLLRQQSAALEKLFTKESALQSEYGNALQSQGVEWWKAEAGKLHKLSDVAPTTDESTMYKRLLGFLSLNTYMLANSALKQDNLNKASEFVEIYRLIDPENAEHRYMAATIEMKHGNKAKALEELKACVNLKFKEFSRLKSDPVFKELHGDPEYSRLISGH